MKNEKKWKKILNQNNFKIKILTMTIIIIIITIKKK